MSVTSTGFFSFSSSMLVLVVVVVAVEVVVVVEVEVEGVIDVASEFVWLLVPAAWVEVVVEPVSAEKQDVVRVKRKT